MIVYILPKSEFTIIEATQWASSLVMRWVRLHG
jgi:hypothetical protein